MKKIFGNVNVKKLKNGSYSLLFSMAIIAIVVIVNLIVQEIPSQYTKIDASDQKLYSIGEQTTSVVKGIEKDVTVYYLVSNGQEDPMIAEMVERYEGLSKHLKVEKKDPVTNPGFAAQYAEEALTENSLIVVSDKKSKVLPYNILYTQEVNPQTMQQQTTGFDGEGQLTSAVDYVTSDSTPVIYQLESHGERALPETLLAAVEKENIDIQSLNLLTEQKVPEDAAMVIICAPAEDFSPEETKVLLSYLENGGKALVFSEYAKEKKSNFESVLEKYGMKTIEGIVFEGDAQHFYQEPYYLVPIINGTAVTSDMVQNKRNILMPEVQGIKKLDEIRESLEMESLLTTSEAAYSKVNVENLTQYEKEEKDIAGPFDLGVLVKEKIGEKEVQLCYFSGTSILDENMNQMVSGGNHQIVMNVISSMCKNEETAISIPSKDIRLTPLALTQTQSATWAIITMMLIPGAVLAMGLVIWLKRRKR